MFHIALLFNCFCYTFDFYVLLDLYFNVYPYCVGQDSITVDFVRFVSSCDTQGGISIYFFFFIYLWSLIASIYPTKTIQRLLHILYNDLERLIPMLLRPSVAVTPP